MGNEWRMRESAVAAIADRRKEVDRSIGDFRSYANAPRVSAVNSSNHGSLGGNGDLVNLANDKPTFLSRGRQLEKAQVYSFGPLVDREALCRGVYSQWNLEYLLGIRELWAELGEPIVAGAAHEHLLCFFAIAALGSIHGTALVLSDEQLARSGPGVIVADERPSRRKQTAGDPPTTLCGMRSFNNKPLGTAGRKPPPGAKTHIREFSPAPIAATLRDAFDRKLSDFGKALQKRGRNGFWLSQHEADVLNAARRDDPAAIRQAIDWGKRRQPRQAFRIVRSELDVATFCLRGPTSSTAMLYGAKLERSSGRGEFLVADPGSRDSGGHDDDVQPGEVVFDGIWAIARRTAGPSLPDARMRMPRGAVSLDIEFREDGCVERVGPGHVDDPPAGGGGDPEPTPDPKPRPEDRKWWQQMDWEL